jgi:hypothetical protein
MKRKHWLAVLLSVGLVALAAEQALAWKRCCRSCSTYICCRPYNAFTPCCFGSICCDGCCPLQTASYQPCAPACYPPGYPSLCPPSFLPPADCCGYGGGFPGGFPGAGYPGPNHFAGLPGPYMLPPAHYNGPQPNFGIAPPPAAAYPPNAGPNGMAQAPRGVYPGFYPNYPMGYWSTAYAPSPHGGWGVPPQGR